jgi:hypothetical protein
MIEIERYSLERRNLSPHVKDYFLFRSKSSEYIKGCRHCAYSKHQHLETQSYLDILTDLVFATFFTPSPLISNANIKRYYRSCKNLPTKHTDT